MGDRPHIAIIGGGPAGLIAAERLSQAGLAVTVYEQKPSVGRKFLLAGRGGLNLTHSEPLPAFLARYRAAAAFVQPALDAFPPQAMRDWAEGLGQPTFAGTSGRVFPASFKASPLLRAWLARLEAQGVRILTQHRWTGWRDGELIFTTPHGDMATRPAATLLALGGASWPRLGSDGAWAGLMRERGVPVAPFRPANCGFTVPWSSRFAERFAGQPLKPVALSFAGEAARGEVMITQHGLEGGGIYALAAPLRDAIARDGHADLLLDLKPGLSETQTMEKTGRADRSPVARQSSAADAEPAAAGDRIDARDDRSRADDLAASRFPRPHCVKAIRVRLTAPASLDRAISSAGGILLDALDDHMMLQTLPSVFAAGEMLDWEAPTGGYLLQASFATGVRAADGILNFLTYL